MASKSGRKAKRAPKRTSGPDAQLQVLRDTFAAMLLLNGVPTRGVVAAVGMDRNRVTTLSKALKVKDR
jgi:hypothetical protein